MNYKGRLQRTRAALAESRLDALLITYLPNLRYLCGFSGSAGVLVVATDKAVFFTDGRYTEQAREEVREAKVIIRKSKSALAAATEWLSRQQAIRRLGFERQHLTVAERDIVAKSVPRGTKLAGAPAIVEHLRMTKEPGEIARIRAACLMGVQLFRRVLKVLRAGVPETELAGELEFAARKAGAEQMSFPTIVASGPRSALPHGRASTAPVPRSGFVVCDFGVILAGYCSDMTRTVHVGRPSLDERRVYQAVHQAQQAALDAVRPGVNVGEVDQAARKYLTRSKLGMFFTHSTGHGLGLEIHESPRVAAGQSEPLREGMVITIEPGAYLPGKFGVRIEDTVVVTETGCEILTPCSKELIVI